MLAVRRERVDRDLRLPRPAEARVVDLIGEAPEGGGPAEIRGLVEDRVYLAPLADLLRQAVHETSVAPVVGPPDERLGKDPPLPCTLDRLDHGLVEALVRGIGFEPFVACLNLYLWSVLPREPLGRLLLAPATTAAVRRLRHPTRATSAATRAASRESTALALS